MSMRGGAGIWLPVIGLYEAARQLNQYPLRVVILDHIDGNGTANSGIGYLMMTASGRFDVPLVFAALVVVGVMGVAMYQAFVIIERRMTFWAIRTQEVVT
jgi:hypothetical protein